MRLSQIRDFLAVAEAGSFRAAARVLECTQPALTKSVRQLEAELGAVLVTRSVRGAVLTPLGQAFAARARAIDRDVRSAREEIDQLRGGGAGSLSVGASTAPAIGTLPLAAARLRKSWPGASVRISDTSFPNVLAELREGRFDLAISPRFGPASEPSAEFAVEHLFENEVVVAVRKGHPRARARSLRELAGCDWLRSGPVGGPSTVIDEAYRSIGLPPPDCRVQCESFLALPELLAVSDSVAIVPWQVLAQPVGRSALVRVPVRERLKPTRIDLLTRAGVPLTPIAKHFVDILRAVGKR
ncbi:MAG: LysR substrate-binding domain-containing protein [Betaproteobacteria bacterium]